jgi:hypothetical protein
VQKNRHPAFIIVIAVFAATGAYGQSLDEQFQNQQKGINSAEQNCIANWQKSQYYGFESWGGVLTPSKQSRIYLSGGQGFMTTMSNEKCIGGVPFAFGRQTSKGVGRCIKHSLYKLEGDYLVEYYSFKPKSASDPYKYLCVQTVIKSLLGVRSSSAAATKTIRVGQ